MNIKTLDEYPSNMHAQLAKAIRLSLADTTLDNIMISGGCCYVHIHIIAHGRDVDFTLQLPEDTVRYDFMGNDVFYKYCDDDCCEEHSERYVEYMERKNFFECVDSMDDDVLLSYAYVEYYDYDYDVDDSNSAILRASRLKNEYATTAHAA